MRQVQINRNLILREDGKLLKLRKGALTGEELKTKQTCRYYKVKVFGGENKDVHTLVMELFGPPKPGPEYIVDHINHNTHDNNITNLRWVTYRENQYNRVDNLPIGQRLCDYDSYNEYSNAYRRERRRKKKEGV